LPAQELRRPATEVCDHDEPVSSECGKALCIR
jgi:hypothetical protein